MWDFFIGVMGNDRGYIGSGDCPAIIEYLYYSAAQIGTMAAADPSAWPFRLTAGPARLFVLTR